MVIQPYNSIHTHLLRRYFLNSKFLRKSVPKKSPSKLESAHKVRVHYKLQGKHEYIFIQVIYNHLRKISLG